MKKFKGTIYQAINIQNKKSYIGKTSNPFEDYKNDHIYNALNNIEKKKNKRQKYFYNAIRKYGPDNFKWIILGEVFGDTKLELKKELNKYEIESIWVFRTFGSNGEKQDGIYGYNQTKGGDGGDCITGHINEIEIREKQSRNQTGIKRSEEFRQNRTGEKNPFYNCHHTEETCRIISSKTTGRPGTRRGCKNSDLHRKRISLGKKGGIPWNKGKSKGLKIDKSNGRYVNVDINLILNLREQKYTLQEIANILNVGLYIIRSRLKNPDNYK
jgi:hypothetical protein